MTINLGPMTTLTQSLGNKGVTISTGAAGAAGTTTNPIKVFTGLGSNDLVLQINMADTTLQLFDSVTDKKMADITIASGTNADFGLKTLGEIAKSATDFDATHPLDLRYADGATVAGNKTILGSILYAPTGSCC